MPILYMRQLRLREAKQLLQEHRIISGRVKIQVPSDLGCYGPWDLVS